MGRESWNGYDLGPMTADRVDVDASVFAGNLSFLDDNVQKALETLDAMVVDLSDYVPYTGATTNVDLGLFDLATTDLVATSNIYLPSFTQGSVLFFGAGGVISENNANLFWDGVNNRLGILTDSPSVTLEIGGAVKFSGVLDMSGQKITALGTPDIGTDAANKAYVDALALGLSWMDAVLGIIAIGAAVETTGNRYIASATGGGWTENNIYEWDGAAWVETVAMDTMACKVIDEGKFYTYSDTLTLWVDMGGSFSHNALIDLQGGQAEQYYHATEAEHDNWFIKNIDDTDDINEGSANLFYSEARVNGLIQSASSDYTIQGDWTFNNLITCANTPTGDNHLARKKYIDDLLGGFTWQEPVIDKDLSTPPGAPTLGDRYIVAGTASNWYSTDWDYRQKVTIDHTKISGDETNFPVLVKITGANDLFTNALATGYDIVFTSSDGTTKIPYQRGEYDNSGQVFIAWVKSDIAGAIDTELYMYYGNALSSDQQDADNTWDANYEIVYHLNESSGTPYDSTSNGNDGINNGAAYQAVGKIGDCFSFDGNNDYIDTSYITDLSNTSNFTISAWMKADTASEVYGMAQKHGLAGYTSDFIFNYNTSTNLMWMRSKIVPEPGGYDYSIWNYLQMVWDKAAGTFEVYVNGVSVGTSAVVTGYGGTGSIKIATRGDAVSSFWGGDIEEVRISNAIRSANWIATSYANQNSPAAFFSMGAEETLAASGDWAGHVNDVTEWDGASWTFQTPSSGWSLIVTDESKQYTWNGTAWVGGTAIVSHNDTTGKQGGTTDEYYHFTQSEHTELSQWIDTVTLNTDGSMDIGAGSFATTGSITSVENITASGIVQTEMVLANGSGSHPSGIGAYLEMYVLSGTTCRILPYDGSNYYDLAIGDWGGGNPNIMLKVGGKVGIGKGNPAYSLECASDFGCTIGNFSDHIILENVTQNYKIEALDGDSEGLLYFSSETSAEAGVFGFSTKDGDGTDPLVVAIVGKGEAATYVNREILSLGWNPSAEDYYIATEASGTGTERDLTIYAGDSNYDQLRLNTDGKIEMHQKQDIDTGTFLTIGNDSTNGLVASSGTDTFVGIDAKVTQTGTAGYTGLNINVTETSTGSGVHQILQTSVGGISKFHVNSDGTATHANDLTVTTGTNTYVQTDELLVDLSGAGLGTIHLPLVIGKARSTFAPIEYALSTYDSVAIWDYSDTDEPSILFAKTDFSASQEIIADLANSAILVTCDFNPDSGDDYDLGSNSVRWKDLFLIGTATVGTLTDGTTTLTAGTMDSVLFTDRIKFTQTDGNEYIDSLNDGYMDYGATTAHRFNNNITTTARVILAGDSSMADYANSVHSIMFGDGQDSAIGYDGSDTYIVNLVGTGALRISMDVDMLGDTFWTGAGTGLPYGIIAGDDETVTCTDQNTWYQVTFDSVGDENLMTGSTANNEIVVGKTGTYDMDIHVSLHTANAQDIEVKLCKNNCATDFFHAHLFITTGVSGKTLGSSVRTIDSLTAADTLECWVRCTSAAGKDVIFDHVSICAVMVGG